ncbi:MAG TPA: immune inhibitor A domain-containing protein [Terriglobales bacterium]|nr:immune inhibitor A domain-containing protein [Terriglobales bacterium]
MRFVKFALLLSLLGAGPLAFAADQSFSTMPPNPERIALALRQRGVIPATATPAQVEAAVTSYLQLKLKRGPDKGNPRARGRIENNEIAMGKLAANLRGRKLGKSFDVPPSVPAFMNPDGSSGKLLLILVEFSNQPYTWNPTGQAQRTASGPLHNRIAQPDNSFDLWVSDFNTQHYEDMLFTSGGWKIPNDAPHYAGQHRGSMKDYFLEQSYGKYTVNGEAYGWFTVDKPEAYYGDDSPSGGNDDLDPGSPRTLIQDVVNVINAQNAINWSDYDTNGDCLIDHPLFIHAGADQSGGGGAQGDDAIWAHSWTTDVRVAITTACPAGLYIYNYTMMPEDGGVGVFAHEFGHDLGLPDEYDTIYSGRGDSVAFWSLMSGGSWVGQPAQTQPSDISIWGRVALGWLTPASNLAVTSVNQLLSTPLAVRLEQAERWGGNETVNAIRINLPLKVIPVNSPHSGAYEWFGGKANEIDSTLRRTVDLTGKSSATLSFWTWYDIESEWDFGFVQVSTDSGATWASLPIAGTSSVIDPGGYPAIAPNLPGFTGSSGGWVLKTFDLSAYAGKNIQLQFRYMTDWSTTMAGFYVDDISVVADGAPLFADTVETLDSAWTSTGWTRNDGKDRKNHYYLAEWRNSTPFETPYGNASIVNFDAGLRNVYQYDYIGNEPKYFSYNAPGLVLWYRDTSYEENWTGVHPGGGYLLVVDAHKQPLLRPPLPATGSLPWNSRVQSYDAAFNLLSAPTLDLTYWGIERIDPGLNAVPNFNDSLSYWSSTAPAASVRTPTYGLVFRVLGQADDGSAVLIGLGTK